MLFLLACPVIAAVAFFWRSIQIYAPSNVLMRKVRSERPRWRTVLGLIALATAMLVAMHTVAEAVADGLPGWLNLVGVVLAWDAIKIGLLSVHTCVRCAGVAFSGSTVGAFRAWAATR